MTKLPATEDEQPTFQLTFIHGDYGPWNLLYSPLAVVKAVLDFDDVFLGQKIEEVAASLIPFAGRDNIRLDLEDARTFLDAYQSISPLNAVELAGLTVNFERQLLIRIVRILKRYQNNGTKKDRYKLHRKIAWLDWLEDEGEEVLYKLTEISLHYGLQN